MANIFKAIPALYEHNSETIFLPSPSARRFELCFTHLLYKLGGLEFDAWNGNYA